MVKLSKGFTLIEMLVSMSLLALVILVGSSGFALFSERWDGRLGKFERTMADARNLMLVQDAIASLVPYVAMDRAKRPNYYFEGNRNGFVAVSSNSVAAPGHSAVVRLSVVQDEDLTFSATYEEWPMVRNVLTDTYQQIPFLEPLILFRQIQAPRFEYLGWESVSDRYGADDLAPKLPPKWLPEFNALEASDVPVKVSLRFVTDSGPIALIAEVATPTPGLLEQYREDAPF